MINLFALPAGSIEGAASVDLQTIPGLTRLLATHDGRRHLLCKLNGRSLQICLSGSPLARYVHLFADAILRPDALTTGVQALELLNQLLLKKVIQARTAAPTRQRLWRISCALDGRQAGASYRDIAIALFGAERVRGDWNDGGDHLKSHIRRLVKRGEALVDGGYRQFLR